MASSLPDYIDPRRIAEDGAHLRGGIPLVRLLRLAAALAVSRQEGEAEISIQGRVDAEGFRVLDLAVRATVACQCRRCLEPVLVAVRSTACLAVVESEALAAGLPDAYEPLLLGGGIYAPPGPAAGPLADPKVSLLEMVEDELLLSLPMMPLHEGPERCAEPVVVPAHREGPTEERAVSPFAVLAAWRKPPQG